MRSMPDSAARPRGLPHQVRRHIDDQFVDQAGLQRMPGQRRAGLDQDLIDRARGQELHQVGQLDPTITIILRPARNVRTGGAQLLFARSGCPITADDKGVAGQVQQPSRGWGAQFTV
jgi:hypothetical protein